MANKDPTLFTATSPIATAKTTPKNTRIAIGGPAPPGETPLQKVTRLREAARKARAANESPAERLIERGRLWADRAHRFTTLSLIGFTAVAGVVVAISLGDMVVYNRRKRNEWYVVQQELHKRDLIAARSAMSEGTANEDQILLINQERLREEAEAEKLQKKGMFAKAKESIFGTEKKEEKKGGTMGITGITGREPQKEDLGVVKAVQEKVAEGKEKVKSIDIRPADQNVIQTHTPKTISGGPLDQIAEKAADSASKTTKSWTDWALRR
ncbi:hypothetical protein BLS_007042 [Venturia inaequalis]|uniref:Cytochrome oxidase c assembly-domain-containing protein n=1 Tax=Venturia inaequalis TaxID=5025 RepID=A0A8H3UBP5_VENIN|nr:hypothetical protein BLS_007042 [Venturia inaequalis]RDI88375.1 hypothetical protein Vi05172_g1146 [Venturia inaequalis]